MAEPRRFSTSPLWGEVGAKRRVRGNHMPPHPGPPPAEQGERAVPPRPHAVIPIVVTPLTAADVAEVARVPRPYRVSGETARLDGMIIAIGGAAHLPDGSLLAFAHLTDAARRRKVWLHKQACRMLARLAARRARIVATASPDTPAAERWLARLGFTPMSLATDDGRTIWIWSNPDRA